ncbi:DUF302 domain-containing protein [Lamprobacter modestohalophilus]|uniref:DUF302 domain-containing protein n=1 Tax=Lamprobacter modestohalophilus TaxID=1064514 RepID=UPI002ADEB701|nr:DUF302 domain-containing protein [Lamprobacter modestohalophilus]MEA1048815.1 DUF302 domain-containing protein [Lamprobacter modestohalophilus]
MRSKPLLNLPLFTSFPAFFLAFFLTFFLALTTITASAQTISISDTVLKMPLAEDVSMDDAVDSMKLRANALNFKLVAELPLSKELEAMGVESGRIGIYQFCDARIANEMLQFNPDFAAYLPCRIALIEDTDGKAWLVTLDLGKIIPGANLPPELMEKAELVRDNIESIMTAGANGDL